MKKNSIPLRRGDVRQTNEKLLLQVIQTSNGMSQSQVVALTGLKAPTVLRIFGYLEGCGLIRVSESVEKFLPEKKGRKPVFYTVNPTAHYTIGIEFWASQISIIMTDFAKNIIYRDTLRNLNITHSKELINTLENLINELLIETKISKEKIIGIGVGAPGNIDTLEGKVVIYERICDINELPLREILEKQFKIPVFINNNASVAAINAYRRGSAKDAHSLITILIRSGVGGAYINNGELLMAKGRTAMEIGHVSLNVDGPNCICGEKGCLETYLAEPAILGEIGNLFGIYNIKDLDNKATSGDEEIINYIRDKGKLLAVEIKNLFRLFCPDAFLIMTRFNNISRIYAEMAREALKDDYFGNKKSEVSVYYDVYNSIDAGRGAADLVFADYFS